MYYCCPFPLLFIAVYGFFPPTSFLSLANICEKKETALIPQAKFNMNATPLQYLPAFTNYTVIACPLPFPLA